MEETKRTFADDEETMVAPRFDDEETVLARPVVPLKEVGDAAGVPPVATPAASATGAPPPLYSRLRVAPRRSLVAALVLVSALVGSVLGVAGLYFYQQRKSADAPATEQQQTEAPAATTTTETASESPSRETTAPASAEPSVPAPSAPEHDADDDDSDTAKDHDSDEADASPVAERRNVSEDREPATTPKRGKKGERDEEIQRGSRRAPRYDEDTRPVVRDNDDDSADDRREARRVGVITYRPRRVRQRRDRYDNPDRLRRIFEGQP